MSFFSASGRHVVRLCPTVLGSTTRFCLLISLRKTALPHNFRQACPGLVAARTVHKTRALKHRRHYSQTTRRGTAMPFAQGMIKSVSCAPIAFSGGVQRKMPTVHRAAMTRRLTLTIIFRSNFRYCTSEVRTCRRLPHVPGLFLGSIPTI